MIRRSFFSIYFFLLFPLLLQAEVRISAIEVIGNQGVEKEAILATVTSRVGMNFSESRIRKDIQALYDMKTFEDIRVEKEPFGNGIRLLYKVVEKTAITTISFSGNKKIKKDKLFESLEIKPYGNVDAASLDRAVQKIQEQYEKEGYHLVEIDPEYKSVPETKEKELIFHIKENAPVRIKRVRFLGNKAFSDRELRKLLKSREKSRWSWLTQSGKFQEEAIQRDIAFLIYHYQNHGYLKVKISGPQVSLARDRKWVHLTFHVTEGFQYHVESIDIDGDILTTKPELIKSLKVKPGELYSREKLEEDLANLSLLYGDQGYAFAAVNPAIQADDEKKTAKITYFIEKGRKVTIEKINIAGNTITRDKVIRRELLVKENTLYNETRLRESRKKLHALGYFEEINFATPRGLTDDTIVLNVTVKEKPTGTFTIGAGFSTAENFIFNASIAKNNFFGYGVSGQASMELSSRRKLFILSAEDPYFLDTNWIAGVSGFRTINVFNDFDRRSFGGSLTFGHRIFDHSIFRLVYQIEDVDVGDFRTAVPAKFSENLSGLTSSATASLQRDTRDNRLFPSAGMFHSISGEYAGLGGDTRFLRVIENLRYYQPFGGSVVGKFNLTVGNIASLENLPVPLFERFFLGGINSLRGYDIRTIGPAVQVPNSPTGGDTEFVFGGNKMLQLNFELELPIYNPAGFKAVTFVDTGQAFSEEESISLRELRSNYGFGLRWNSPIGPLRFEWGLPIKKQPQDSDVVFNFAIGSFF